MSNFEGKQLTLEYSQIFNSKSYRVFQLLCPTREYEWIEPWKCDLLYSSSGYAEKGCVFRTGSINDNSDEIWLINRYEPYSLIEFIKINKSRIISYQIILSDNSDGTTKAYNIQTITSLNSEGTKDLEESYKNKFIFEMKLGEVMLNHYLSHEKMLPFNEAIRIVQSI